MVGEVKLVWRQRWTGKTGPEPRSELLPGLWQIEGGGSLDGQPFVSSASILGSPPGRWTVVTAAAKFEGDVIKAMRPPGPVLTSILELSQSLVGDVGGKPVQEWLSRPVLLLRQAQHLAEPALVKLLQSPKLLQFTEVFRKPATRLTVDTELQAAGRAKRIPVRAVSHLAAHPEEWEAQNLVRILPRRIMAEVREEELGIYENRVASRLLDEVLHWVDDRIRNLTRLVQQLDKASDFSGALADAGHRRRHRLAVVWAGLHVDAHWAKQGHMQLEVLRAIRRRLLTAKDSALYGAIPVRSALPSSVRETNLFRDHRLYRSVFELWKAWSVDKAQKDAEAAQVEPQAPAQAMDAFVVQCAMHALAQDNFRPADEAQVVRPGYQADWHHAESKRILAFEWRTDGTARIGLPGKQESLHLIGVPASLSASGTPTQTERLLRDWCPAPQSGLESRALIHIDPGETTSNTLRETDWLPLVDRGPLEPYASRPWLAAPISPWAVDSVERIGRLIRSWVWSTLTVHYPPRRKLPAHLEMPTAGDVQRIGGTLVIAGPSTAATERWVEQQANLTEDVLRSYELEKTTLRDRRDNLARQRELTRLSTEASQKQAGLRELLDFLGGAKADFAWFVTCPVCQESDPQLIDFEHREDCFHARCGSCDAPWGIVKLACKHRVPFCGTQAAIRPGRDAVEDLGVDLLAQHLNGRWSCPTCDS